jgi:hypothetical protein
MKQRHAKLGFEQPDALRDVRLHGMQMFRRLGDAAGMGHGSKYRQIACIHHGLRCPLASFKQMALVTTNHFS